MKRNTHVKFNGVGWETRQDKQARQWDKTGKQDIQHKITWVIIITRQCKTMGQGNRTRQLDKMT